MCSDGLTCVACAAYEYKATIGRTPCVSCPANSIVGQDDLPATQENKCTCATGYYHVWGGELCMLWEDGISVLHNRYCFFVFCFISFQFYSLSQKKSYTHPLEYTFLYNFPAKIWNITRSSNEFHIIWNANKDVWILSPFYSLPQEADECVTCPDLALCVDGQLESDTGWGGGVTHFGSELEVSQIGLHFGLKKTEFLDKSSKTIDILTFFFEPKWSLSHRSP